MIWLSRSFTVFQIYACLGSIKLWSSCCNVSWCDFLKWPGSLPLACPIKTSNVFFTQLCAGAVCAGMRGISPLQSQQHTHTHAHTLTSQSSTLGPGPTVQRLTLNKPANRMQVFDTVAQQTHFITEYVPFLRTEIKFDFISRNERHPPPHHHHWEANFTLLWCPAAGVATAIATTANPEDCIFPRRGRTSFPNWQIPLDN